VVESVVRDALALSRSSVTLSGVDVQTQISAGLPRVWGDPVQLLQVMVNLVVNGCEAMSLTPQADRRLRLQAASIGHEHVQLSVADCGVGLPRGGEDDVFEPFFTTKPKGLGLGLAIGRSIVTAHGGRTVGRKQSESGRHVPSAASHGTDAWRGRRGCTYGTLSVVSQSSGASLLYE
jgi:C4-dicarboxylate-specific signal transduction histidine kinase